MSKSFRVGEMVYVSCPGLAAIRRAVGPGVEPNHHGRVEEILEGGELLIEFPIGGTYEHSQSAPYPAELVHPRN